MNRTKADRADREARGTGDGARTAGGKSRILDGLDRGMQWFYRRALTSFIGKWLTDYRDVEEKRRNGWLYRAPFLARKRNNRLSFRAHRAFSSAVEKSAVSRLLSGFIRGFLECSVNTYGLLLLLAGLFSILVFCIGSMITAVDISFSYIWYGGSMIILSIPLLTTRRSLAAAVRQSFFGHLLFVRILGIEENRFTAYDEEGKERQILAVFLALGGGVAFMWVSPVQVLLCFLSVFFLTLIWQLPEIGLFLSVGLAPFLALSSHPTQSLLVLVGITVASFLFKLFTGKRILHIELVDITVLLLSAFYLLGGISLRGGGDTVKSALCYLLLLQAYFLAVNLIRSEEDVRRMAGFLLVGASVVSIAGILQYFVGNTGMEYLDLTLFSDLRGRATATWENPNVLAEYLAMIFPLACTVIRMKDSPRVGALKLTGCCLMGVCLVLTWSRGAWLGTAVALLWLCITHGYKAGGRLLIAAPPVAAASLFLLPEQVLKRIASVTAGDGSVQYRVTLWKRVGEMLREHWICGVGVGEEAFVNAFRVFAGADLQAAVHSHSLYLQLLCAFGIVGLLVFLLGFLLWLRRILEFCRYTEDRLPGRRVMASFSGVCALLVMGLFDEVFYNYRIFFLFWMMVGFGVAQVRVFENRTERLSNPVEDKRTQYEVTYRYL